MKMAFLILLTGVTLTSYCQETDTLFNIIDTIPAVSGKAFTFHKPATYIAPATCIIYGILAQNLEVIKRIDRDVSTDLQQDYPHFNTHIDDKLQYIPAVSVYALGFLGIKGKNSMIDKTALYFISNAIMGLSVDILKNQNHKLRPDGSDYRAFPSGHTATAFVAAEFMNQEYRNISPWYSLAGYTIATATGTLRMLNNKHWLSDVVTGAGIGILSTKLAYIVYPIVKRNLFVHKRSNLLLFPAYQHGMYGFSITAWLN